MSHNPQILTRRLNALFARPDGMWNGPVSAIITDRAEGEVGALVYFGREGHPFPGTDDQPSD